MKTLFTLTLFLFGSLITNAQSQIAHLSSQEVMAAMPSYNEAIKKLETFQQELLLELQEMKEDFDENIRIYQEMITNGTSQTLVQIQEQKLTKKETSIREREQAIQGEIEAYSRELNYPIIEKVNNAMKTVSDRNNFDYVFDVSTLMIHNGPDITREVINEVLILEKMGSLTSPPQEEVKPKITQP